MVPMEKSFLKCFEMFLKRFSVFRGTRLRRSLGELSFRENKFMKIANSTWTFSSKNYLQFKNALRLGVHEEHSSDGVAFIILLCFYYFT